MGQLHSTAPLWGPAPDRFPWPPVGLATAAAVVAGTRLLVWMVGAALYLFTPEGAVPPGFEPLAPTANAVLAAVVSSVILPLLAIVAVLATWHAAFERRVRGCWVAAVLTIALTAASFVI